MKKVKFLALEIMIERQRLESMAERFGLLHPTVLRQSKKLDKLVNQIQQRLAS